LHFVFFSKIDPDFAQRIVENTRRYGKIFSEAIDEMLPNYKDREVRLKYGSFYNFLQGLVF
jgi:CRISPR/Cas system CSM-associated protein Csm2 small subunit